MAMTEFAIKANMPAMDAAEQLRRYGRRLREARKGKGWTLEALSGLLDISASYLSRMERGELPVPTKIANAAAALLDIPVDAILSDAADKQQTVAIMGYVGAGEMVYNFEDPGGGLGRRELDGVAWTPKLVGLVVRGESMLGRCDEGDVLIFERTDLVEDDAIGRVSVVQVANGPTLVKQLFNGSRPGRFTLVSRRVAPMMDVELVWAARVRAFLPR